MALLEYTLDRGNVDKEAMAIARIREFEAQALRMDERGYYVCDSGGKDSLVVAHLAYMSGVKYDLHHNHTTADHPVTVRHVRYMKAYWLLLGKEYYVERPMYKGEPTSMWALIPQKGLPTRLSRWCCHVLKESGGIGRTTITGVRRAESVKRSDAAIAEIRGETKRKRIIIKNNDNDESRNMLEMCPTYNKVVVNPIVDWSDADVWEYIHKYDLPYNPLYDMGYKRVGCVGCPMAHPDELRANPAYYKLYRNAAQRYLDKHPHIAANHGWRDADDMMSWWLSRRGLTVLDGQTCMWDEESDPMSYDVQESCKGGASCKIR